MSSSSESPAKPDGLMTKLRWGHHVLFRSQELRVTQSSPGLPVPGPCGVRASTLAPHIAPTATHRAWNNP
jgi:hypothetical protein